MNTEDEIEGLKAKFLCSNCVEEVYLGAEIKREGRHQRCSYCGGVGESYTIGAMADRIELAFEQHFVRTSDQP